ncbi:MAG TPA: biopolymer transporter ExbD [Polyangiaceae bacterium]|jgi:biopolymer transport protein ExbD|nr:biopolymer transporter ExbD [Polyangiaceae bacterium]
MTIAQPGRRLMHFIPLKFVQHKVTGGGKRSIAAALSLTSMIDFLVVTVVFLLMTFSASGETTVAKGVTLPKAENTLDMIDAPLVAIAGSQILVDGNLAGNTRAIEDSKRLQRIDELFNVLKGKRELWKQLHPNKEFPGVVVLQIDQEVPAIVVKSVFQTAAFSGYPNVSFMVNMIPKEK